MYVVKYNSFLKYLQQNQLQPNTETQAVLKQYKRLIMTRRLEEYLETEVSSKIETANEKQLLRILDSCQ